MLLVEAVAAKRGSLAGHSAIQLVGLYAHAAVFSLLINLECNDVFDWVC